MKGLALLGFTIQVADVSVWGFRFSAAGLPAPTASRALRPGQRALPEPQRGPGCRFTSLRIQGV